MWDLACQRRLLQHSECLSLELGYVPTQEVREYRLCSCLESEDLWENSYREEDARGRN